ncbi:MAG: CRTAC1 family protein [Deltaproteobacteria bacterium]|nr:CRTAC1 family protein [Nannocystaceae bacterium]
MPAESSSTGDRPDIACEPRAPVDIGQGFLVDVSEASGIQVGNYDEMPAEGTAINDHSRLAFADIDGDGFDDAVMHSLYPNAVAGVPLEHLVFRNLGDGTFEDVTDASGLRGVQAGFFAFGDVDDDGDQDVFAGVDIPDYPNDGNLLLLNDGSGHFEVVADAGVSIGSDSAANATFGDFDRDGTLDLFVGYGGTSRAVADRLFAGNGDGTFADQTAALQDAPVGQPANGSITCDWDDDLDLDIFVSNYGVSLSHGHNHQWRNDGSGLFTEVGLQTGFAAQITGNYWLGATRMGTIPEPDVELVDAVGSNGFGIDCGDVDNDGDLDVLATAISHPVAGDYLRTWSDPSTLLVNGGSAEDFALTNVWLESGLPFNEGDIDGAFVDFDNDGRLDISLSRESKYEANYDDPEQHGWFGLAQQDDSGGFTSVGLRSGINDSATPFARMKGAQNHAWSDVDHDGDLDLLVGGRDQGGGRPNFLFRNDVGQDNRWLAVRITGDGEAVTRDAFGTRVRLRSPTDERVLLREKKSSRGTYNSEDTRVLHFGLGDFPCDYTLDVRWPDGSAASFTADQLGENRYVQVSYPDVLALE